MKKYLFMLLAAMWFSAGAVMAQSFTPGTITAASTRSAAGNCNTIAGCVTHNLSSGDSSVTITLSGTFAGTFQFEFTNDGTNWVNKTGNPYPTGAAVSSTTAAGTWTFAVGSLTRVSVRASSYTSGTATVRITSSSGSAGGAGTGTVTGSGTADRKSGV